MQLIWSFLCSEFCANAFCFRYILDDTVVAMKRDWSILGKRKKNLFFSYTLVYLFILFFPLSFMMIILH